MKFAQGQPTQTGTHTVSDNLRIQWKFFDGGQHCAVIEVEVRRESVWGLERTWGYHYEQGLDVPTAVLFGIRAGKPLYRTTDFHDPIIEWLKQQRIQID